MKQSKTIIIAIISILGVFLAACGSDSGTDSNSGDTLFARVESIYDLGECEALYEGVVKWVISEGLDYTCRKGVWEIDQEKVPSRNGDSSPKNEILSSSTISRELDNLSSSSFVESATSLSSNSSSKSSTVCEGSEYDATSSTLKDCRDGKIYRTVQIGDYIWMAENLNYSDSIRTSRLLGHIGCYKDKLDSCVKYGRFYAYSVTDIACPIGWHLPYVMEVDNLIASVGGNDSAMNSLRSKSGWIEDYPILFHNHVHGIGEWPDEYNGTDDFGFSALPSNCSIGNAESECRSVFWIQHGGELVIDQLIQTNGRGGYNYSAYADVVPTTPAYADVAPTSNSDPKYPIRCVKDYAYEY